MITKPIIFSAPMIQAILAGAKTQTRRVIKPQPEHREAHGIMSAGWAWEIRRGVSLQAFPDVRVFAEAVAKESPHPVGSIAWVREACWIWGKWIRNGSTPTGRLKWRFLARPDHTVRYDKPEATAKRDGSEGWIYRHARYMPRWASRISLLVTAVKVERVASISEEDARAEGVIKEYLGSDCENFHPPGSYGFVSGLHPFPEGRIYVRPNEAFRELWDSINGARPGCSWDANPFVWAYTFKRVEVTA